mmetsp:Transcript_1122/g.3161  ORF Transcript_1122/g.3161 Transcript_1122/m.3161 type:complete len:236 (+) Transcript_1122:300-1007(+)
MRGKMPGAGGANEKRCQEATPPRSKHSSRIEHPSLPISTEPLMMIEILQPPPTLAFPLPIALIPVEIKTPPARQSSLSCTLRLSAVALLAMDMVSDGRQTIAQIAPNTARAGKINMERICQTPSRKESKTLQLRCTWRSAWTKASRAAMFISECTRRIVLWAERSVQLDTRCIASWPELDTRCMASWPDRRAMSARSMALDTFSMVLCLAISTFWRAKEKISSFVGTRKLVPKGR